MTNRELYLACLNAVRGFSLRFGGDYHETPDPNYVQLRIAANIAWQKWLKREEISA